MIRYSSLIIATALGTAALPALAEAPKVVTDIPVVGALVQQVMGDLGQPEVLLQAGGDPHSYQLRPSQARSLQDADLLIWVGPELTPWLERAKAGLSAQGEMLTLLDLPGTHRRTYAEDGHGHDHEHEHEHEHDDHAGDEGHDHSGADPHAWLDPANGRAWLAAIADTLSLRDPDNAPVYAANAAIAINEISALDDELKESLRSAQGKRFVVFHDAYGYFTEHYGLEPAIAVSLGDASTPSAARLKAIRDEIVEQNAVCAFPEANHDPKLIVAAVESSSVRQGAALDPEGAGLPLGPGLYAEILRGTGQALADCLGAE